MNLYLTFTRSRIAAVTAGVLLFTAVCGQFSAAENTDRDGATNALRVSFAQSIGCQPDENACQRKDIVIPERFSAVYTRYNELQKKAGYDLSDYRGCAAILYTYPLTGVPDGTELHLIVCFGRIIGGDVASAALNGRMLPLDRNAVKKQREKDFQTKNGKNETGQISFRPMRPVPQ